MKYYYEPPQIIVPVYGEVVTLKHPVFQSGTLYFERERGIIVVQQYFDIDKKACQWKAVNPGLANDIYLSSRFHEFFLEHATEENFPIYQVRKLMWALRMKPLSREPWEDYF
ncbi:MAG: hypothetical protein IJ179_09945 [Oscillospiraceae bacterium]|nr:hypothetical protein [Oscillospiraceae bacterium]